MSVQEPRFTPGPHAVQADHGGHYSIVMTGAKAGTLAMVLPRNGPKENEANANLFGHATDMFFALRAMVEAIETGPPEDAERYAAVLAAGQDALAKAAGVGG